MIKVLFICHGNICRSPMAEFVMKDLVKKAGLASQFHIESAATSREEIGNPVYGEHISPLKKGADSKNSLNMEKQRFKSCLNLCQPRFHLWSYLRILRIKNCRTP